MVATARFLSHTNGFIPAATGVVVAFVRDRSKFKFNDYVESVKADKPVALFHVLDPDSPTRVVSSNEFDWPDGQPAPRPQANLGTFRLEETQMNRKAYAYNIGEQAVETADGWNPRRFFDASMTSLAVTEFTWRVIQLLENTASWGANTAAASTLNGGAGTWENASNDDLSVNYLAINKSLLEAIRQINLATNGVVGPDDLRCVISPRLAQKISQTAEIRDALKQSQYALGMVTGKGDWMNKQWGVPDYYAGVQIVVEDASRVSVRAKADGTAAVLDTEKVYVKSHTSAVLCSKPGKIEAGYGQKSFSTVQRQFYKYEFAVESEHKSWDKLYETRVVDQGAERLVAPTSGYLITGCAA